MRTEQEKQRRWITSAEAGQPGDPDYEAWLAKDIDEATAELDAGKVLISTQN
ncbi:hypothetical protein [Paracoccus laeviglucosivorans]|uniref:Uncharacterized protein n=1 Tax=Paracoccus laeviglucosivorans TaxID=1197861 RepID=A0A521FND2_9RHOB|nr:hypothetical protein [Paracoccus laeviglucosivorans]SMO97636.1 hypothetical protein SAMN06265221_12841 [Paracoccus laeviglucosivorans]